MKLKKSTIYKFKIFLRYEKVKEKHIRPGKIIYSRNIVNKRKKKSKGIIPIRQIFLKHNIIKISKDGMVDITIYNTIISLNMETIKEFYMRKRKK